jgi:hypothetical protein
MNIGVTDPAVRDLQMDIMGARFAAIERERGDGRLGVLGCVTFGGDHGKILRMKRALGKSELE